jgi:carbon storage regulator
MGMLVLSRKENEKIIIDDNIILTIVKCESGKVKIGLEAPGHISIYREEIYPGGKTNGPERR